MSFRDLRVVESEELIKIWNQAEHMAREHVNLYLDLPWMLGCQDREFAIDGKKDEFPAMPWIVETVIEDVNARWHTGVWEFSPSDLTGKRRCLVDR